MNLEKLAKDIISYWSNDMGVYFDQIQGHEREVFDTTMEVLTNKELDTIDYTIDTIEDWLQGLTDTTDIQDEVQFAQSIVERLNQLKGGE